MTLPQRMARLLRQSRAFVLAGLAASAVLNPAAAQPEPQDWVRDGLEWGPAPPPIVDQKRVEAQQEVGCSPGGPVRFADTAPMRGAVTVEPWSEKARQLAAAAAFLDDPQAAMAALREAAALPELTRLQQFILQNQQILTALQFEDDSLAESLLAEYGLPAALQGPLRSDRLFWSVLVEAEQASVETWRATLAPRLEAAFQADAESFQIRFWRVLAWLKSRPWTAGGSCRALAKELSDRVLDLSEASPCPLMLSHAVHAMDRLLEQRSDIDRAGREDPWRTFVEGVLAVVSKDASAKSAAASRLNEPLSGLRCADDLAQALRRRR